MGKVYTGIDIGSSRVKFSVCDTSGAIKIMAEAPLPEKMVKEGRVTAPDVMSEFLKAAAREKKATNKETAVILPAELVFFRRVFLPLMTEEQLRLNLPYEFRDYITQDKDKYFYDYALADIKKDEEGNEAELDLIAAATAKSTISNYMTMFRRAGYKLRAAAPVEYAFSNIIRRYEKNHPSEQKREYCIIDLGHTATRLHIYTGSNFEVTRIIDIGGDLIDAAIADELTLDAHVAESYKIANKNNVQAMDACRSIYHNISIEIMRAINFYGFNNHESNLTDAYYCGGGALIPLFLEEIANTVNLNLHSIEELLPAAKNSENALLCAAAAGIALQ